MREAKGQLRIKNLSTSLHGPEHADNLPGICVEHKVWEKRCICVHDGIANNLWQSRVSQCVEVKEQLRLQIFLSASESLTIIQSANKL